MDQDFFGHFLLEKIHSQIEFVNESIFTFFKDNLYIKALIKTLSED